MGLTLRDRFIRDFRLSNNYEVFDKVYLKDVFDDESFYLKIKDSFCFPLFVSEYFYLDQDMKLVINHYFEDKNEKIKETYNNYLRKNIESWKFKYKLEEDLEKDLSDNKQQVKRVKI